MLPPQLLVVLEDRRVDLDGRREHAVRQSEEPVGERALWDAVLLERRLEGGHEAVGLVVAGRHLFRGRTKLLGCKSGSASLKFASA